jgi:CBS domain-containing protein
MQIGDGMTSDVLTIEPRRTLREAARAMVERNCGSAVVMDPEAPTPGIITERDLLRSLGEGQDPDSEVVSDHLTAEGTFAERDWSIEQAADAMLSGGFRHLVVMDGSEPIGVISMRDVVRHTRSGGGNAPPSGGD